MGIKRVILIGGSPGSGKTTIRRLAPDYFRPQYGETAALETDEFYSFVDPYWSSLTNDRWLFAYDTCLTTATWLLQHHITTIFIFGNILYQKDTVNRALKVLSPYSAVFHITLDAAHSILVDRLRQRGDLNVHPPERLASWQADIQQNYALWTTMIDTSDKTPQQVLDIINNQVQQHHLALGSQVV
ncbi:MAG: ATP-binding protein [Chloroflexota bacterium]|nr:ATP-binding protein [Chloroflexota bacterium]